MESAVVDDAREDATDEAGDDEEEKEGSEDCSL
jgi:hypothetical protein